MKKIIFLLIVVLLSNLFSEEKLSAKVVGINGVAQFKTRDNPRYKTLKLNQIIYQNYTLRLGNNSSMEILLESGTVLKVRDNSVFLLKDFIKDSFNNIFKVKIRMFSGKLRALVNKLQKSESYFKIETPTSVAGVRGTDFIVEANK